MNRKLLINVIGSDTSKQKVLEGYENVIYTPYRWVGFGHFTHDHICSMLFIPQWIWDTHPAIMLPHMQPFTFAILKATGFFKYTCMVQPTDHYVYAKKKKYIYMVKSVEPCLGFGVTAFKELARRLRTYYGTESIISTDYFYMNKEPNRRRHFLNLNESVKIVENETKLSFKYIPNDYSDMKSIARNFALARILIIHVGSIVFNCIYMNPKSAILVLMAEIIDWPDVFFCYQMNIWSICQVNAGVKQNGALGNLNQTEFVINVKRLLFVLDNGKYPANISDYKVGVNIQTIMNLGKKSITDARGMPYYA